jgi:transglutaminase-like putative cysteine protease
MYAAPRSRAVISILAGILLAGFCVPAAQADTGWEPVTPAELALAHPTVDPDADAEALFWTVRVEDHVDTDLLSVREHYLRVKVFTQNGAQTWSKRDIDFADHDVRILDLAARTIEPDGSVRVLDPHAIAEETVVKVGHQRTKRISFAFPGVQPGSIVEYRYTEYRRGNDILVDWFPLQLTIPVQRVTYRVHALSIPGLVARELILHAAHTSTTPSGDVYETTALNQPAFTTEPDMPPELQELAFLVLFYTTDQEDTPEAYWPAIGRGYADWFKGVTDPDGAMRHTAADLTRDAPSDRERVRRIAEWVRSTYTIVRSVSDDTLRAHHMHNRSNARAAWKQHDLDYSDALLVFAAMVRAAGLEARWVKVPSRSELFFDRRMLNEGFLQSYQIAVRLEGRWVTFDPITQYLPWDMESWDEEATLGLLCDADSSDFIETALSPPERTGRARRADFELKEDGTLEGTVRIVYSGHWNAEQRSRLEDLGVGGSDSLVSDAETAVGADIRVSDVRIANPAALNQPLDVTGHIVMPGFAPVTGKRILLEPAVFYAHARPRYLTATRRHPVYYPYAWSELDTISVRLPEGWKVGKVASVEPLAATGVADYAADTMVSDDGRTILFVRRFRMGIDGSIYFQTRYYPGVKQLFDGVHQRDGTVIELTREGSGP